MTSRGAPRAQRRRLFIASGLIVKGAGGVTGTEPLLLRSP